MDDVLWLLIGLGGGLLMAAALPRGAMRGRSADLHRQLVVIAAGGIGAVLIARALVVAMPATETDSLTTSTAALAGALWIAALVGITLARRRRGDDTDVAMAAHAIAAAPMHVLAYDAARQAIVDGLTEDASAHDAGRYAEVGRRFSAVRRSIPGDSARTSKLHTALRFWGGWMQARDARWSALDVPGGVGVAEWPALARTIASDLALDRELSSPRVRDRFAQAGSSHAPAPNAPRATAAV